MIQLSSAIERVRSNTRHWKVPGYRKFPFMSRFGPGGKLGQSAQSNEKILTFFPENGRRRDVAMGRPIKASDIAHVFYLRGYMEKVGWGSVLILQECAKSGLSEPKFCGITRKRRSFLEIN